jgi:dUTP pyrophosphatase
MSAGAAGMDLSSAADEPIEIAPGGRVAVPTGLAFEIPAGFEVQVLLANLGAEPYVVNPGDRVAQLVIAPVVTAELEEATSLEDTHRGDGGFGHTGR